ncbi:MAG: DUF1845 family protein [Neisseriaceae bacterium]|nr:DUF1845 family protein [Neisseriaceae bacterium]MBR5674863.1 DUF1845 family protein [Neisseriaceae bacterium]
METEKREIVLSAKSIKINSETPLPNEISVSKNSPFSDGYDYYAEIERLESLPESEQFAQQAAFDLLAERELLLKQAIHKKDFFIRRFHISPDDIDLAELHIIPKPRQAGRLRNQKRPDRMEVHIRDSAYLWFGQQDKNQKRKPGLRSAAINLADLAKQALDGNFYAEAVCYQAEIDIAKLENTIEKETKELTQQIEEQRKKGLFVEMLASDEPRKIEMVIGPYGGRLALLLLSYDKYYRTYLTIKKIRVTAEQTKKRNIIRQAICDFCEEINDKTESLHIIQSIKNVNRHQLLNDDEVVKKLCEATAEELLPPLPLGILLFELSPTMISINNPYTPDEIEQLKQIAVEKKLVQGA